MKIHSDILNSSHFFTIARSIPSVYISEIEESGSRSHNRAWNVYLSGTSQSMQQHDRNERAATYEQWGYFLAAIYELDSDAKCGYYKNLSDFNEKTNQLFSTVTA